MNRKTSRPLPFRELEKESFKDTHYASGFCDNLQNTPLSSEFMQTNASIIRCSEMRNQPLLFGWFIYVMERMSHSLEDLFKRYNILHLHDTNMVKVF